MEDDPASAQVGGLVVVQHRHALCEVKVFGLKYGNLAGSCPGQPEPL